MSHKVIAENTELNDWGELQALFHLENEMHGVRVSQIKDYSTNQLKDVEINWYGTNGTLKDAEGFSAVLTEAIKFAKTIK